MKVHKVTLLVVDSDDLGAEDVRDVLENARYPNHCIGPSVMQVDTVEVEWSDEHPLNRRDTMAAELERLFSGAPVDEECAKCGTVGPVSEACRGCQASSSAPPNNPAPCGHAADAPAPPPPKPCAQRHPDGDRWCYLDEGHEGPHDAPAPRALPRNEHMPRRER